MMRMELDSQGQYNVRWPETDEQTLQLAGSFVTYEESLSADQQSPLLPLIRSTLATAKTGVSSADGGEKNRAVSAEELRKARADAKKPLKQAFDALKLQYSENLAELETYGLETKEGDGGVIAYAPKNQPAWDNFLVKYVEVQGGLDASAQIQKPALSTLSPLAATVSASLASRKEGRAQREIGVSGRRDAAGKLHDLLEVAAGLLVVARFDFKLTKELLNWGYEVIQVPAATLEPAAVQATAPAGG